MSLNNKPFQFLTSGIDSLYVGYNFDLSCGQVDFDDLDYRKALLKGDPKRKAVDYKIGNLRLGLTPSGAYPYAHILTQRHFRMKLARRMQPSCMVEYASEGLWADGVTALTGIIADWSQSLGLITIKPDAVSRLDYAFDYWIPNPDFVIDHFVSRSRKDNQWREHGNVQTLQFGSGDMVVRIYHKSAEIEHKQVWRIKFQFRHGALRKGGINNVYDIKDQLGDILREIVTHHTTQRSPSSDSNRSRWPLDPLWEDLQQRIQQLPQVGLCRDIRHKSDLSIPDQIAQCERFCKGRDWQVQKYFIDAGASATNDTRPEFQAMIAEACSRNKPFDVILVHSQSRFARNMLDLLNYTKKMEVAGVQLVPITQDMGTGDEANFVRNMLGIMDEHHSKETSKHVKHSMAENARQGFWNGSRPPFGYETYEAEKRGTKSKKKLRINTFESETVKLIFKLYVNGDGRSGPMELRKLSAYLNERDYTN